MKSCSYAGFAFLWERPAFPLPVSFLCTRKVIVPPMWNDNSMPGKAGKWAGNHTTMSAGIREAGVSNEFTLINNRITSMRLLGSLFSIVSDSREEGRYDCVVRIESEHFIYKAHFPGEPITPGVCIMQMAIELLEEACGQSLALQCAKNIKYLKVISPTEITALDFSLDKIIREGDRVQSQICVAAGNEAYAKLSLTCQIME